MGSRPCSNVALSHRRKCTFVREDYRNLGHAEEAHQENAVDGQKKGWQSAYPKPSFALIVGVAELEYADS